MKIRISFFTSDNSTNADQSLPSSRSCKKKKMLAFYSIASFVIPFTKNKINDRTSNKKCTAKKKKKLDHH